MASFENPQPSPPTTETPAVPLPPLPQTPALETSQFLRLLRWLDGMLFVVVLLFAFLIASFPVTNSDFFRHAAIGRLLAEGRYQFWVDPFVYTAGDAYFVNHSWLFDLLMYRLYSLPASGALIVIFKALLITVLAAVLLGASRRTGQSLWIPAVCTALAILVASPRFALVLQSTCLSFLFLGLTIFIVSKGETRLWWLLPPLFALWVNCDSWFFLGPLTVGLYLVGGLIHQPEAPARTFRSGAAAWLVLLVGIAACLINPHQVRAFTLPPEFGLTATGNLLENDPQFHLLFLSPLSKDYYKPFSGLSVAGLAYWPLLLLGLASFVFLFKRVPWPRLLVWTGFALMSLYNWRAIPFFAIVAGPITALNWLDFAAGRLGRALLLPLSPSGTGRDKGGAGRNWSLGGRVVTLLLGLALLIVTVPGWLQKSQPAFHRTGWSVLVDPTLQAMAQTIRGWREAGQLPEEPNWFNMYAEIANYLAWFAPGERAFLDPSLPSFRAATEDYLAIRQGLEQETERDLAVLKTDWRKILHDRHVRFWIFDALNTRADLTARLILFLQSEEWVLCHLGGRIAIFAWRDPQQPASSPSPQLALDLKRSAFGTNAEPAPSHGVEPALPRNWWQACWEAWRRPDPPLTSDRDSLAFYDFRYQYVELPREIYKYSRTWQGAVAAGAIASSLLHGPVPHSLLALSWSCTYNDLFPPGAVQPLRRPLPSEQPALQARENYVNGQFLEPPSLYLAVRAARRALRANPEDELTYLRLGQVYQHLRNLPQEGQLRTLPPQLSLQWLDAIRRTQMAAALQNCLRLQPDDDKAAQAHEALYRLYYHDLGYIDAAVQHLHEALEKRKASGPITGLAPEQYTQMLDQMSAHLTRLENELERRRNRYEVNTAGKSGLEKVKAALREGLSETALTELEQEASVELDASIVPLVKMVTGVVLDLGRLDKARELLPDLEGQPVKPEDLELYLRLAAARGDYAEADRLLDDALRQAWQSSGQPRMANLADQVSLLVGRVLLAEGQLLPTAREHPLRAPCMPWLPNNLADLFQQPWLYQNSSEFWRRRWRLEAVINGLMAARQQAEWHWMRGWLALEAGHCGQARRHFQMARDLTVSSTRWVPEVQQVNAWLVPQEEIAGLQQLGFHHALLHQQSMQYLHWLAEF